ncbi:MAG: prepilin-type N-terminal cleavage/methylation domain-containing protein [Fimbriimonadales bacterium]|nr:prepilin-type N-terminal cleavage/methylation domain-containing protein [Fimbriimonadales bacterium]
MRGRRRPQGFTVMEVMIVVLIVGVLVSIAVPQFLQARGRSMQRTCMQNLRKLADAKEVFAQEHKKADGDSVTMADLYPDYVRGATAPTCPAGGTYTVGPVGSEPTCSYVDGDYPHQL